MREAVKWAIACMYLVDTRVRVSSAESWVALKPTNQQICENTVLAMANQNSVGIVVVRACAFHFIIVL